jgi:multiple sugar transport system ATP-binding protein
MATVELIDVTKRFGGVDACAGVNLRIEDREFVTLLGPSGCGKSTSLNLIAGLDDVTSGEILIDGQLVNNLTPYQRDVAMVFQQYALYPHMTVGENIGFTLRLRKRPKREIRQRVEAIAASLELTPFLDRLPRELSGGQQQRVAIGRAVIREPRVFLFDEPFSNLDAALRVRMRTEVKELHQRLGATSIFVTHDQEEAMSISDRIAVMRAGRVEQYGTPEEVYARPATKYVAQFIGSPRMDLFEGTIREEGGTICFHTGPIAFPLPPSILPSLPQSDSQELELGVRSEHVKIDAQGVPAVVQVVQPIGPETHVTVGWDGWTQTLTARQPGISRLQPGASVMISLDPEGILFFDRATGVRVGSTTAR